MRLINTMSLLLVVVLFLPSCKEWRSKTRTPEPGARAASLSESSRQPNSTRTQAAQEQGGIQLVALVPNKTKVRVGFNVQPDGTSALAITSEGASPHTVVMMDGKVLSTTYGNPKFISVIVPNEMFARPGERKIELIDGDRRSKPIAFEVEQ